jgi:serine/threonine protein kinase
MANPPDPTQGAQPDPLAETLLPDGSPLRPDAEPGAVPPSLACHPRYRILELLGRGGMGSVFKAEHTVMGRVVALKVLHPHLVANPEAVERFHVEVRGAARLNHPNIVTAYDADQADDLHFFVMEFVPGRDLANVLRKVGPLPVAHACEFVRQAALGLQHAHEQGLVHRDLKPHNLMLTGTNQIKILDFGLARFATERRPGDPVNLTGVGAVMGSPDYIAPEQGRDARTADIRADVYSLGCTLYHLLAGQVPFPEGTVFEKVMKHSLEVPRSLAEFRADLPAELRTLVATMMAKDPARRFQTPAEVARAMGAIVKVVTGRSVKVARPEGAPVAVATTPPPRPSSATRQANPSGIKVAPPPVPPPRRSQAPWLLLGLLAAAVGAAALFWLTR